VVRLCAVTRQLKLVTRHNWSLTGAKWSLAPLHLQVVHNEHAKFVVEGNSRKGGGGVKIYFWETWWGQPWKFLWNPLQKSIFCWMLTCRGAVKSFKSIPAEAQKFLLKFLWKPLQKSMYSVESLISESLQWDQLCRIASSVESFLWKLLLKVYWTRGPALRLPSARCASISGPPTHSHLSHYTR
jgi:hypothetical protein